MKSDPRVHYLITEEELQRRFKSKGQFQPRAICGYGKPHFRIKHTRSFKAVTCPDCRVTLHLEEI